MKKIYKVILIFIAVTLLMTSFVACDFDESRNHLSGGDILDREKMSEIKNEIISNMFTDQKAMSLKSRNQITKVFHHQMNKKTRIRKTKKTKKRFIGQKAVQCGI